MNPYDQETLDFVRHGISIYDCALLGETEAEHCDRIFDFLELGPWFEQKVVVDVGCGIGGLLDALRQRYPRNAYLGVTNCEVQCHIAWQKSLTVYRGDMNEAHFAPPADLFIFEQSIGHAHSMPKVIAECALKLNRHGRLFIKDFDCVELSARNAWDYRMEPAANFVRAAQEAGLTLVKQEIPKVSHERYMKYWRDSAYMTLRYGPAPEYMIANSVMLLFQKP